MGQGGFLFVIEWIRDQGIRKSFAYGNVTFTAKMCGSAVQAESFRDTTIAGEGPGAPIKKHFPPVTGSTLTPEASGSSLMFSKYLGVYFPHRARRE